MASILDFMGSGLTSPEQLLALRAHNDAEQGAAAAGPPPVNWNRVQLPSMPDSEQGPRGPGQGAAMAPATLHPCLPPLRVLKVPWSRPRTARLRATRPTSFCPMG